MELFKLPVGHPTSQSSVLRALVNRPDLNLEIIRVWSFGVSLARSQSVILSGDYVRVKGLGGAWKPMRFEYVQNGIAYFRVGTVDDDT